MTIVTSSPAPAHDPLDQRVLQATVSIVIPTYNRPHTLSRLLESLRVLNYERSRLEVVVVGSKGDPGRAILQTFVHSVDFRATYVVVSDDLFRSASFKRNEGARMARGSILAFTDDDCVVSPDWVKMAVPLFNAPEVGGLEGAVEIPKPDQPTLTYRGSQRLSNPGGYQTCNIFYRKSVFEECGGFDAAFPYYLEDTDLAYTVMERGYTIPFGADCVVTHPVQPGRPLKLLTMARTVELMPYLFSKHRPSRRRLRTFVKPLNRSHYFYLALYAVSFLTALVAPTAGGLVLGLGLAILLPLHLAHDFWGLHFTVSELALTALCQPIVPLLRLFYWLKGSVEVNLAPRRPDRWLGMNASTRM